MSRKIAKVFSWFLLTTFFVLCGLIVKNYHMTYMTVTTNEEVRSIREEITEEENSDWSKGMLEENPDYAGWLTVYGTSIDLPVVLGETNNTYLRQDFYGNYSIAGTLFFDETTDFTEHGNRIIYGHKMRDDTMFGSLENFKDIEYLKENRFVTLEDINGTHLYEVFAVMVVPGSASSPSFIDFQKWNNTMDIEERTLMVKKLDERSSIYREPFLTEDSTFLFLISCDFTRTNGRLCVVAESITEADSIEQQEQETDKAPEESAVNDVTQ